MQSCIKSAKSLLLVILFIVIIIYGANITSFTDFRPFITFRAGLTPKPLIEIYPAYSNAWNTGLGKMNSYDEKTGKGTSQTEPARINQGKSEQTNTDATQASEPEKPKTVQTISALGRPMEEPAHVSYTDNVYFTIKTTERNYKSRLSLMLMTWLQLVKHKVVMTVIKMDVLAMHLISCSNFVGNITG